MRVPSCVLMSLVLVTLVAVPAGAEVFLRGNAGWLDVGGGKTHGIGYLYQGGGGGSVEIGLGLSDFVAVGVEYAPVYNQPVRVSEETKDLHEAEYSALLGNVFLRLEPIENVRPYFIFGGGRSAFAVTYADSGKVFTSGSTTRTLASDQLNGWAGVLGFGFEAPLMSHVEGGFRGRYLIHRWESMSQEGILYSYPTGDAYSIEATLKYRF